MSLTDGVVTVSATGEVLESVSEGNTVLVKVLSGTFQDQDTLDSFLKSDNLSDTSGSKIDDIDYLSDGLIPFDIDDNIALVTTSEDHNLGIGDIVNVSVNPDDNTKTVTYYVRKRIYQEVELEHLYMTPLLIIVVLVDYLLSMQVFFILLDNILISK